MHFLSHCVTAYTATWDKEKMDFHNEFFVLQEKLPFQEKTPIVSFSSLCGKFSHQTNLPDNHYHHLLDKRQETFLPNCLIFIQVYLL